MQVAAASPLALDAASLDQAAVEREREVYRQKALEEGKPAQIVDKIADGAVKKFQKEVCLMSSGTPPPAKTALKPCFASSASFSLW